MARVIVGGSNKGNPARGVALIFLPFVVVKVCPRSHPPHPQPVQSLARCGSGFRPRATAAKAFYYYNIPSLSDPQPTSQLSRTIGVKQSAPQPRDLAVPASRSSLPCTVNPRQPLIGSTVVCPPFAFTAE